MIPYNQLELVHTNSVDRLFRVFDDWNSIDYGFPSPGETCVIAYTKGDNDETLYMIAEYTTKGFEEYSTTKKKKVVIQNFNVIAWKRIDLPY